MIQRINEKLGNLRYGKWEPCNEKSYELLRLVHLIFIIVIKIFFFICAATLVC